MTNPRTGEIIGADIMLEFVHFTNRVFYNKLVGDASKNMDLENDIYSNEYSEYDNKFFHPVDAAVEDAKKINSYFENGRVPL